MKRVLLPALAGAGVLLFAPIWKSGKRRMSGWDFIWGHTIWGPDPLYIPEHELYAPLTEEEWERLLRLREEEKMVQIAVNPALPVSRTWNAINATPPPVAEGEITAGWVYSYNKATWFVDLEFPVSLDVGALVYCTARCENRSDFAITVNLIAWLTDPDGMERGRRSKTVTLGVGEGDVAETEDMIPLDKEGIWQLHARMELA